MSAESMAFFLGGGLFLVLVGTLWLKFHKSPSLYQILKRDRHDKSAYFQKYGEETAIKWSFIFGLMWLIAGIILLILALAAYLNWF